MNEKPAGIFKSIWGKSWNEPRHFFFWLALLSPVVFVLVVAMSGLAGTPPPLVHWLALGAIIGFILGAPAFVVSWIPPVRRVLARVLQRKLFVFVCLVTLVTLFYAVENWRGRNAWNHFRREWESRGVRFDLEGIIPPRVPDDQNFFATFPWEFLRFTRSNNAVVWQYDEATRDSQQWLDAAGPRGSEAPGYGDLFAAKPADLGAWQDFYRGSNNLFAAGGQTFTNFFPIAPHPQTPAKDVLLALTQSDPVLQEIRAAARRPKARFWINYEDGFAALLPHLGKMKGDARYMGLQALAQLADGQSDLALDDVKLAFRLNDAIRDEPLLISQLVRLAALQISLLPIWDGLADHRWSDAQLEAIERELAGTDCLADYQTGMNGERVFSIWTIDYLKRTRDMNYLDLPASGSGDLSDQIEAAAGRILFRLIPGGWFDRNKVALGRMHVEGIRPLVDQEKQLVLPATSRRTAAAIQTYSFKNTPYDWFTGMLIPALDKAAKKFAVGQTYVNLARIACALERFRLAQGSYPETLEALVPKFINPLSHDVINGQPLKYRRTGDGSFVLYSVGWNETDDGGTVVMRKGNTPSVDQDKGDWVWRYPTK